MIETKLNASPSSVNYLLWNKKRITPRVKREAALETKQQIGD